MFRKRLDVSEELQVNYEPLIYVIGNDTIVVRVAVDLHVPRIAPRKVGSVPFVGTSI